MAALADCPVCQMMAYHAEAGDAVQATTAAFTAALAAADLPEDDPARPYLAHVGVSLTSAIDLWAEIAPSLIALAVQSRGGDPDEAAERALEAREIGIAKVERERRATAPPEAAPRPKRRAIWRRRGR